MNNSPFLDLARKQAELFQNDNINWMETLITCECTKSIMEIGYNVLVRQKVITPIEDMAQEDKLKLWESAKEFANGRLDQKQLVRVAKSLLTLESLL